MFVLEVIGIVLAVAPLLIEAGKVSHNVAGSARMAASPNKHREFVDEFLRDLAYELTMFKMTLEELVSQLNIKDSLKQELLREDHLDLQLWVQPSTELLKEFHNRLGTSLESFVHSFEGVFVELGKLVADNKARSHSLPVPLSSYTIVRHCTSTT
jgi:hypothetical protein